MKYEKFANRLNNITYVEGIAIKKSSLNDIRIIEQKRWYAHNIKDKLLKNQYNNFFKALKEKEIIWGYYKTPSMKKTSKMIFTYTNISGHRGFNNRPAQGIEDLLLTSRFQDLPLYINKEMTEKQKDYYKKCMSGKQKLAQKCQKLVDLYFSVESRLQRAYKIISICTKIIERDISNGMYEKYQDRSEWARPKLVKLNINERAYYFLKKGLYSYELTASPEDPTEIINY